MAWLATRRRRPSLTDTEPRLEGPTRTSEAVTRSSSGVDLAKRVLSDSADRRRYDSVLALQDLVDRRASHAEVLAAAKEARIALTGWRCPPELAEGVGAVVERAATRLAHSERNQSSEPSRSDRTRQGAQAQRTGPTMADEEEIQRLRDLTREMTSEDVARWMTRWGSIRLDLVPGVGRRVVRSQLYSGYLVYRSLRSAQSHFKKWATCCPTGSMSTATTRWLEMRSGSRRGGRHRVGVHSGVISRVVRVEAMPSWRSHSTRWRSA
jgi:hypothetical protein